MATLEKISLPITNRWIIREAVIDEISAPENSCELAINMNFDRIGAMQTRKGLTLVGSQIASGTSVQGIGLYRDNAGTKYRPVAKVWANVYAYTTEWNLVRSSLSLTSKASFTNLADYIYMVDGNSAIQSYNGSGNFSATNVGSLPSGDFIENFRARLWVADNSTDRVYYSNVVSSTGTIEGWTDYIQISPNDGEKITALKRHPNALLVFKQNHIYRIFGVNSADPDPFVLRGTYSAQSIVETKSGIFYHHPTGIYQFMYSGDQKEISRPIVDFIEAVPRTYWEEVSGWNNGDSVSWSLGDLIVKGVAYTNVVVRYSISTEVWTIYSYSSELLCSGTYDDGTNSYTIVWDDDGNVLRVDYGTTDNGDPIFYDYESHNYYFTGIKSTRKTISEIGVNHQNALGAKLSYKMNDKNWIPFGQIKSEPNDIFNVNAKDFIKIRFKINGVSVGEPLIFRNFDLLNNFSSGENK